MRHTLIAVLLLALSLGSVSAATVTGKVIGMDGKPISGANICLIQSFTNGEKVYLLSDAAGNFSADIDVTEQMSNAPLGSFVAYAPGYALASAMLMGGDNNITLSPGTTISGTVVDADGKPLAGVPVRLIDWNGSHLAERLSRGARCMARTLYLRPPKPMAPGACPVSCRTGTAKVVLDDDRYVRGQQEIALLPGEKAPAVHFTARPGATLTGRVLTPKGEPAADAKVRICAIPRLTLRQPTASSIRQPTAAIALPGYQRAHIPSTPTARSRSGLPNR